MGRELQKRKNRSSIAKKRQKPKSKKKILSNPIIAANWNQNETLTQNYRRLGLSTKLNRVTGGTERTAKTDNPGTAPLALNPKAAAAAPETQEARIERDPETGEVRIVDDGSNKARANPLNDPLNDLDPDDEEEWHGISEQHSLPQKTKRDGNSAAASSGHNGNTVIAQLEAVAASGERKAPRKQSEREQEWVARLVAKYGDDYARMSRDAKLNPMQQSEGDIKRRVARWKAAAQGQ
ncbi:nucleolar protein 16 [Phyllosticta citribraziliensis]|uniref:Nucleolar protein 16 n=1 Tax=Phyllosticta citribraziliensis TaxID=989973 RepID=A0ABR1M1C0_9PEZI